MVGTGLIFIWNMVIKSAGAWASAILAGKCGNKLSNVRRFIYLSSLSIILQSGESVTSFTKGNSANFSSEKW